jgi:hypothetical protein
MQHRKWDRWHDFAHGARSGQVADSQCVLMGVVALSVPGPEPDPCAGRRGLSEHERELVKRRVDTITGWQVCGDGVVAAAQVLHERLSGGNGAGGG